MFRWIRSIFSAIAGWFGGLADGLQGNKNVMAATYDRAIAKQQDRFETVKNAVAELMGIEQTRIQEIKGLHDRETKLEQIQAGSKAAMQRRINQLKDTKTKEQIQADPEFILHQAAYKDATSTLVEVQARIAEKEVDLTERQKQISTFKIELQGMQRSAQTLKSEKSEALADTAIAQQAEAINNVLAGISQDTTDKDLESVRAARQKAKARSTITAELVGANASVAENQYLELAKASQADAQLDGMLDWGDKETPAAENLADAKLSE